MLPLLRLVALKMLWRPANVEDSFVHVPLPGVSPHLSCLRCCQIGASLQKDRTESTHFPHLLNWNCAKESGL